MAGKSELQLQLTEIVLNGTAHPVLSSDYKVSGKSSGGRSTKRILGGTGLGAVIGAIAGNAGMGAAIIHQEGRREMQLVNCFLKSPAPLWLS